MAGIRTVKDVRRVTVKTTARGSNLEHLGSTTSQPRDALRELCHDLLQPAATIGAVVAAMQIEASLPPETRDRLRQVTLEAKVISDLCHSVLYHRDPEPTDVQLDELAAEVGAAAGMNSEGTVSVHRQPSTVRGEPAALRRALWNLVDNARRAAGPDGHVSVTVTAAEGFASVSVADSGGGFGNGQSGVAGLGLRIAARVAEEHGGGLSIGRSDELGGAEVTLTVPCAMASSEPVRLERGAR